MDTTSFTRTTATTTRPRTKNVRPGTITILVHRHIDTVTEKAVTALLPGTTDFLTAKPRGATTFSKFGGGVQFLGLGYCTEQNTDGIPSFVHYSVLRNVNHTLHQKSWGGLSNFFFFFWGGGSGPPDPPVVAPLAKGPSF